MDSKAEKKSKITNKHQFQKLVSLMEENPQIAKGIKFAEGFNLPKERYNERWNEFAVSLNTLGPPIRTAKQWQKVWADYKLHIKRKLVHNKKEAKATGGGPNTMAYLSVTEEAVVNLLSLDKTIDHSGPSFGIERNTETDSSVNEINDPPINLELCEDVNTENEKRVRPRKENVSFKQHRKTLLEDNIKYSKRMEENTRDCARYLKKLFHLEEEKFQLKKEMAIAKEKRKREELDLKIEIVNYKKQKLALLERNNIQ